MSDTTTSETDGAMLVRLGTNAVKWAEEFIEREPMGLDGITGWFANAIMAGYDKGRAEEREQTAAPKREPTEPQKCRNCGRGLQRAANDEPLHLDGYARCTLPPNYPATWAEPLIPNADDSETTPSGGPAPCTICGRLDVHNGEQRQKCTAALQAISIAKAASGLDAGAGTTIPTSTFARYKRAAVLEAPAHVALLTEEMIERFDRGVAALGPNDTPQTLPLRRALFEAVAEGILAGIDDRARYGIIER